jgi:hypothetical protein
MSPLGSDFPRERFLRTPVSTIRWVLAQLSDREQAEANLNALPVARLTQILIQIAHGFSGSKRQAPKLETKEFLPYPSWRPANAEADGPSQPTRFVLTELAKRHALPVHVFAALMSHAERRP